MNNRNNTIEKLIASPVSALVVGFFVVIMNLSWFIPTASSLRVSISDIESSTLRAAITEIDSFLESRKTEVVIPARYMSQDLGSKKNDLVLREILTGEYFASVTLSDKNGKEIIKYDKYRTMMAKDLTTVFERKDFREAIKTSEVSWSDVSFSLNSEPSITVNVPIFSVRKDLVGVLSAEFRINEVLSTISGIGITGDSQIYVVEQSGILVSSKDLSLVLRKTNLSDRKIVKDTLLSKNNIVISSDNDEYSYQNEAGVTVLAVGGNVLKTDWAVIFEEPKSKAVRDITILTIFALLSTAFLILMIIFVRKVHLKVVVAGEELKKSLIEQRSLFEESVRLKRISDEVSMKLQENDKKFVEKVNELEDFQKFVVNRELRMVELKEEIAELKSRLPGQQA